jgi:hypothetical protein
MTLATTGLRAAADRLIAAAAGPLPWDPVRDLLGDNDIASAYTVQRLLTEHSLAQGRRIVGHKIGLTSPAVQRQLGVDPTWGCCSADSVPGYPSYESLPFRPDHFRFRIGARPFTPHARRSGFRESLPDRASLHISVTACAATAHWPGSR